MMDLHQPGDLIPAFAAAYQTGRVEGLLELFEPDAMAVGKDGAEHRGHDAIARELAGLVALGGAMTSINRYTIVQGEIALLSADWKVESQDANGAPLVVSGRSAEVARRQADGRWLYIVDHPFGA